MANEYLSLQLFEGDGVTTDFSVNFAGGTMDNGQGTAPYINIEDVKAYEIVPGEGSTPEERILRDIEVLGPLTFRVAPAVPVGRVLEISRETEERYNLVDFKALQTVSEFDLDLNSRQLLFVMQEVADRSMTAFRTAGRSESIAKDALETAEDSKEIAEDALRVAEEARDLARHAIDLANKALELAGGFAPVVDILSDTVLDVDHTGKWLRLHAPLSSSVRRLTIPLRDDWPAYAEVLLEQDGPGYGLIEADEGVTLRYTAGTAPVIRNGQQVACLKLFPNNEWVLFGGLEDL